MVRVGLWCRRECSAMKNGVCIAITSTILGVLALSHIIGIQAQKSAVIIVIVNRANPHSAIDREELARLFLKKKLKWSHGVTAMPVDQKLTSEIRRIFSQEVLLKPVSAVNAYWQQRIFSGRGIPPPQKTSDSAVVLFVASNPGAVGYISASAAIGKVKVLSINR